MLCRVPGSGGLAVSTGLEGGVTALSLEPGSSAPPSIPVDDEPIEVGAACTVCLLACLLRILGILAACDVVAAVVAAVVAVGVVAVLLV